MNYTLSDLTKEKQKNTGLFSSIKKLYPLLEPEKKAFGLSLIAVLINSALTLIAPLLIAHTIDVYIVPKHFHGVIVFAAIILLMYIGASIANYIQTIIMGTLGQRTLFRLRNEIFNKLQELPVSFFNQNKVGDLISRINNDTDKLNQALVQLSGNVVVMFGAAVAMLIVSPRLGVAALLPSLFLVLFTRLVSPWVKKSNTANLQALGGLSAEVQESLENFKVVAAFNRRDYFRERFHSVNMENYHLAFRAGIANNIFSPVYTFFSNIGHANRARRMG
jgi:ATP-binding cassette subfamily B protein